ncbi:MAG: BACON domain-containing protein [Rikenellaceae bacterium]
MKKTFLLSALAAVLTLVGCKDEPSNVETGSLSVDPTSLSVASSASSNNVTVKADGAWTATTAADWVTLSVNSGTGNASLIIMVAENEATEERLAEVVFTSGDSQATVSIEQAAYGSTVAASFNVEGITCTSSSIYANVTPENYTGTWYVGCAPTSIFEDTSEDGFGGDAQYLAEYFMYLECDIYGTDLSVVDYMYVFEGACEGVDLIAGWGGDEGTEYAIIIFGINAVGDILTDVTLVTAATEDAVLNDFTIECQFNNVTATTVDFAIYPSDQETYYVYSFYTGINDFFEQGGTQASLYKMVLEDNISETGGIYVGAGDLVEYQGQPLTMTNLPASTEIFFVGFGLYIDGNSITGRCNDAQIYSFTTAANSPAAQNSWSSVESTFKVLDAIAPMSLEQKMVQSRAISKKNIVKK